MAEQDAGTAVVTERVTERTTEAPVSRSEGQPGAAGDEREARPYSDLDAANAEIRRLRGENASRRVDNRTLHEQIDALRQQVPSADVQRQIEDLQAQLQRVQAAGEAGISPELLRASERLRAATSAEEMRAAQAEIARLTAPPPAPATRNPAPPAEPSQPLSRDEQTAAAMQAGNMREVERLNAEKLAELSRGS